MKLENQIVIVSGAGSGIGRAIALRFANEGANIVIVYSRNDANAMESARMIEELGRKTLVCKADVSNKQAISEVVEKTLDQFQRIDCLVNNAGIYHSASIFDMEEKDWDRVIDVDLKSVFLSTQIVARHWRDADRRGKVINIGSVHGTRSHKGLSAYASARMGLVNLTRVHALELAPYGITVNVICPGAIRTGGNERRALDEEFMKKVKIEIPLGRMGEGEEIANLALFLASDESDYITGSDIIIDGGLLLYEFTV